MSILSIIVVLVFLGLMALMVMGIIYVIKWFIKTLGKKEVVEEKEETEVKNEDDFPELDANTRLSERSILDVINRAVTSAEKEFVVVDDNMRLDKEQKLRELEETKAKLVLLRNYGHKLKELFERYKTREKQLTLIVKEINKLLGDDDVGDD